VTLYVATAQQSLKGHTMEYFFLFVIIKLIVVWMWLERDAF